MPRPIRAERLPILGLALGLSLGGVLAGCGDRGDDVPPLGGDVIYRPAEPGQTSIPDTDRTPAGTDPTTNSGDGAINIPVADEPEPPGTGS